MKSFLRTILICVGLLAIVVVSAIIRKPSDGNYFEISDATYHVLLTVQAYDETDPKIHKFLPIQTYSGDENKFIQNGPSLVQDEYGNNYYVSFSPIGFYVPYFFCKLFDLDINITSLYLFNTVLMSISGLLMSWLIWIIFRNRICSILSFILYLFLPEVLYTQGIVYWHHSLSQVFLLAQICLFTKIFIHKEKVHVSLKILFYAICFIFPYTEWTGFVSNVGCCIVILIDAFTIDKPTKAIHYDHSASTKVATIGLITFCSLLYYFWRFSAVASPLAVIQNLLGRASARSSGTLEYLMRGYLKSLGSFLFYAIAMLVLVLIVPAFRSRLIDCIKKAKKQILLLLIVLVFPLAENLVMMNHAVYYTFDRLKIAPVLIVFTIWMITLMGNSLAIKRVCICLLAVPVCFSVARYGENSITNNLTGYENSLELRDNLEENYLDQALLVKDGWRAWGYLQTLYQQNIYCTDLYNFESISEICAKQSKEYIVLLFAESVIQDTATYSKAIVLDLQQNRASSISVNDGEISLSHIDCVYAADLTDDNWTNGIRTADSGTILFDSTYINSCLLAGVKNLIINDKEMPVISVDMNSNWITVTVDGDASAAAYPNKILF